MNCICRQKNLEPVHFTINPFAFLRTNALTLQAGIEFKKNLRVRSGKYGGLKLEYFLVVKSKKAKSFLRG